MVKEMNFINEATIAEDRSWFRQNPARQFRVRRAKSDEYNGEPPSDQWVYVIVPKDAADEPWEHVPFTQCKYLNVDALTDEVIRAELHQTAAVRKC
jgi:hypothetical protein